MTARLLNIAILLAAIVLSALLVRKFFFQPAQNSNYRIATNATLIINGINWADSDRTLLIALGKECKYCSESAEFYRRLAAGITSQTRTRLIAVFSEKESEAEAYLRQLEIPIREVHYVSLSSLGIKSVPTLAILDRNGVVTNMWAGKLSPLKEKDLTSKLRLEDTRSPDEWSIKESDLQRRVINKELLVLLDIRERAVFALNHRDGARNIPLDELPVRAQNELPLDHTIVIYGNDPYEADLAYSILDTQGFTHVFVLVPNPTQATKPVPIN
ncbi:MAG TPA: rhodanese-like domain-containing protein [Pyrinomonadaceae bacterium]|nr:rhodanese-like domain-containing protein [Pyrinomonadaceae bacterium]